MNPSNLVLLKCRLQAVGNLLRAGFVAGRRLETSIVSAGVVLLLVYWAGTLLQELEHFAWCRSHPGKLSAGLLTAAALSGALAAYCDADRVHRLAGAPFLSILPWSDDDRRNAMQLACAPVGCAGAMLAFMVVYAVSRTCDLPQDLVMAASAAALFGSAFFPTMLGSLHTARRSESARLTLHETRRRNDAVLCVTRRLDRGLPCWLGSWALGRRRISIVTSWSLLLCTLGTGAAAGSVVERSAGPAVITAVLGGHIVFLVSLRAAPLVSGALRMQPVSFLKVVWGVTRLPLFASVAWFCLPALSAFAATANPSGQVVAGTVFLLLLDAMFVVIAVSLPRSPRSALVLHFGALTVAAQNLVRFGVYAEAALLLLFLAYRLRNARRDFHV